MPRESATVDVTDVGNRIAAIQKRKAKVNSELVTVNRRRDALQAEAESLAKEHLALLRTFDSVAKLP